ncbi:MAG: DUF2934 domain-containing protein [Rhodocyclaceae bacterium]|jgi:hypothetical protein
MSPRTTSPTTSKAAATATSGRTGKAAAGKSARAAATVRSAAPRQRIARTAPGGHDEVERRRFIAEAAYFRAEQRGFAEGGELADWIAAEAEIDALLDSRGAG